MVETLWQRRAPRWGAGAAIAAVGIAACLAYYAAAAHGIGTSERDWVFSPADSPWSQAMLPALDVPIGIPPSVSAVAARFSMFVALGRRTALRDLAAIASALATVMLGVWLIGAGVPPFPALFAMLGMAAGLTFWWRGVSWTPDALSPALALLAAWLGWRWLNRGAADTGRSIVRRALPAVALLSAALAIAEDAAWVALVPAVVWLYRQRASSHAGAWSLAALALIAMSAAIPFAVRAIVARDLSWAALLGVAQPGTLALWRQSIMSVDHSPVSLLAALSRELTPLGAMLAAIGAVTLCQSRAYRNAIILSIAGLCGWYWLAPHSRFEALSVPFTVCGWAAVAAALWWLQRIMTPGAGRALVAIAGLVILGEPALTRMRLAALGRDAASDEQARIAYNFETSDLPAGAAMIAEARRADAVILLSSRQSGPSVTIVPQTTEAVQATRDRSVPLLAFANGRANLEKVGFLFERRWVETTAISLLGGRVPCVDLEPDVWVDVSLLLANGSFILHGAAPDRAPGGAILRLTASQPVVATGIEPRSIPFEIGEVVHDTAAGIPELDRAAAPGPVPRVATLRIRETPRPSPITMRFATPPAAATASADPGSPVTLCPGVGRGDFTVGSADGASGSVPLMSAAPFGPGWHAPEADPSPFRWTAAPRAAVRVSVARPGPIRVTVVATPAAPPSRRPEIDLWVNHCRLPAQAMTPEFADHAWEVEASCWRDGVNQLWLGTGPHVTPKELFGGHDTRPLGARITAILLRRN